LAGFRHREEIIYDILQAAVGEHIVITRIMSAANLTSLQTKECLDYVIQKGLLKIEPAQKSKQYRYKTTPKGIVYLNMIDSIHDILPKKKKSRSVD